MVSLLQMHDRRWFRPGVIRMPHIDDEVQEVVAWEKEEEAQETERQKEEARKRSKEARGSSKEESGVDLAASLET